MGKQSFAEFLESQLKGKKIRIEAFNTVVKNEGIVESIYAQGGIEEEELCIKFCDEKYTFDCLASTQFEFIDE